MAPGSNAVGKLILTGVIHTVKLGGANLQLDDVCINPDGDPNGGGGTGVPGCTYDEASNFNPEATEDDGSCQFGSNGTPGCTYATAVTVSLATAIFSHDPTAVTFSHDPTAVAPCPSRRADATIYAAATCRSTRLPGYVARIAAAAPSGDSNSTNAYRSLPFFRGRI